MTALFPSGVVKVFATFMRVGRQGADVDNAGKGGNVDCSINIDTGVCENAIQFNSFSDVKPISNHPDSGSLINGVIIDNWAEIVHLVSSYQKKIPYIKIIGWDIALTDNGPIVIEINNWWDTTGQIFIRRGWRDDVLECYNAWEQYYKHRLK